jgi:hypothetical protein
MSVKDSAHLRATVLAVKAAPREVRKQVRSQTRAVAAPQWKAALASHARTEAQSRMLVATARITVSDQSVRVRAAGSKRKVLSGGAIPYRLGKAYEFGRKSRKATQLPPKNRRGYVFYPALAEMSPRIIALWVQTAIRTVYDAIEGKR